MPASFYSWENLRIYLVEFLVIFASITVSFLTDAYREEREERTLERQYLNGLIGDLRNDLDEMRADRVSIRLRNAACKRLLLHVLQPLSQDSIDEQIYLSTGYSIFCPTIGSYLTLTSGHAEVLQNDDIRKQTNDLYAQYELTKLVAIAYKDFYNQEMMTFYSTLIGERSATIEIGPEVLLDQKYRALLWKEARLLADAEFEYSEAIKSAGKLHYLLVQEMDQMVNSPSQFVVDRERTGLADENQY
jgi:hypothetical protein